MAIGRRYGGRYRSKADQQEEMVQAVKDTRQRKRTEWMGAVPQFSPNGPPRDWQRQHNAGHDDVRNWRENRPVPRQASCHYYRKIYGGIDFYMY